MNKFNHQFSNYANSVFEKSLMWHAKENVDVEVNKGTI